MSTNKIDLTKKAPLLVKLAAGERFTLENAESLAIVRSGKIEVYSATDDDTNAFGETTFRQSAARLFLHLTNLKRLTRCFMHWKMPKLRFCILKRWT